MKRKMIKISLLFLFLNLFTIIKADDAIMLKNGVTPDIKKRVAPKYPHSGLRFNKSGRVILLITIDEKGSVIDTKVIRSTSCIFHSQAIKAIKKWKYKPYQIEGKPVKVSFQKIINFRRAIR